MFYYCILFIDEFSADMTYMRTNISYTAVSNDNMSGKDRKAPVTGSEGGRSGHALCGNSPPVAPDEVHHKA